MTESIKREAKPRALPLFWRDYSWQARVNVRGNGRSQGVVAPPVMTGAGRGIFRRQPARSNGHLNANGRSYLPQAPKDVFKVLSVYPPQLMNTSPFNRGRNRRAFTLIELLVVISIIAILAAMILPALARARITAQKKKAALEIAQITAAINDYEQAYGRLPVSKAAIDAAAAQGGGDFTFGTFNVICAGRTAADGMPTPSGPFQIYSRNAAGKQYLYQTNNAEVMAILLDLESFNNGAPTLNQGHVKNTKRTKFLNATMANDNKAPGVGTDGVYRDPWGNPYIISIDLNNDEKTRDEFFRLQTVSQQTAGSQTGLNGLFNAKNSSGNSDDYEFNGSVMVWSAGPDKNVDKSNANLGVNKDNIMSWKPGN